MECEGTPSIGRPYSPVLVRKDLQQTRVSTSATLVKVRRSSADSDQSDVHVECAVDPDDVTQKPPILINAGPAATGESAAKTTRTDNAGPQSAFAGPDAQH